MKRPYLVKLVQAGELSHRKVGLHHRMRSKDVLIYRARLKEVRSEAMQDLAYDLQELGLG